MSCLTIALGAGFATSKSRCNENLLAAKARLRVRFFLASRVPRLFVRWIIHVHNDRPFTYFNADCDACTAHPPMVPEVVHVWLVRVEKYT
jgi:hypothetical protein